MQTKSLGLRWNLKCCRIAVRCSRLSPSQPASRRTKCLQLLHSSRKTRDLAKTQHDMAQPIRFSIKFYHPGKLGYKIWPGHSTRELRTFKLDSVWLDVCPFRLNVHEEYCRILQDRCSMVAECIEICWNRRLQNKKNASRSSTLLRRLGTWQNTVQNAISPSIPKLLTQLAAWIHSKVGSP